MSIPTFYLNTPHLVQSYHYKMTFMLLLERRLVQNQKALNRPKTPWKALLAAHPTYDARNFPMCGKTSLSLTGVEAHMEALRQGWAPSALAPMWLHTDISDLLSLSFDSPALGALRPTCPFIIQLPTCNSFIQQLFIDCLIDTNMFKAFGPVLKELTVDWGTWNGSINICNPRQGEIKYTSQLQKLNALGIHRTVALLVIPKKANYRKNKMNCVTKDSQDSGRVMLAKERGRREQTWRRGSEFGKGRAEVQTLCWTALKHAEADFRGLWRPGWEVMTVFAGLWDTSMI